MNRERQPMLMFTSMASPSSESIEMYASVCHRCKYEDDDCATILCPVCARPTVWEPTRRSRDFFDRRTAVWVPDPASIRAEGSGPRRLPLPAPPPASVRVALREPAPLPQPATRWWAQRWMVVFIVEMVTLATVLIAVAALLRN